MNGLSEFENNYAKISCFWNHEGSISFNFFLWWLFLSVQWLCKILHKNFPPWSLALWWNFKLWQRMKVGILINLYSHLFPIPKQQLFSKDYFAVYNNTLWENLPLLPDQKIWRTLYNENDTNKDPYKKHFFHGGQQKQALGNTYVFCL